MPITVSVNQITTPPNTSEKVPNSLVLRDASGAAALDLKPGTVIEGSSTMPALRVTQTGSGNALVVEDDTHPDSTPLVVNNLGQIISGATTAFSANAGLQITADSASAPNANISLRRCSNDGNTAVLAFDKTRGSAASPLAAQQGDALGQIVMGGHDGAANVVSARIRAIVDGAVSSGVVPTALTAQTGDGASTVERMRITSAGNVGIATTTPTAKLHVSGDAIVAANTSTDALRITQEGSGNALVVEDDTHPDSTPLVINNVGQIISGATTPVAANAGLQLLSELSTAPNANIIIVRSSDNTSNAGISICKTRGTTTSRTSVNAGDSFGSIDFTGHDGTAFIAGARISSVSDGTPGTNDMPGRLAFSTTADGASAVTERMRIDSAGNVGIGGIADADAILDLQSTTKGFLPPRLTTTQRDAIAAPIPAGLTVYNTTTNKLNFYNGSAWEAVTSS